MWCKPHYVVTAGTTTPGQPLRHEGGEGEEVHVALWHCPKLANDWTLAEPSIDKLNRFRQRGLALGKARVTTKHEFGIFTTTLGMIFVNTYTAWLHAIVLTRLWI